MTLIIIILDEHVSYYVSNFCVDSYYFNFAWAYMSYNNYIAYNYDLLVLKSNSTHTLPRKMVRLLFKFWIKTWSILCQFEKLKHTTISDVFIMVCAKLQLS